MIEYLKHLATFERLIWIAAAGCALAGIVDFARTVSKKKSPTTKEN